MDNTTFTNSTNGTFEGFTSSTPPKSFWGGLLLPVLYLTILVGSLATFSSLYRRRQVAKAAKLESWFPPHRARDVYLSLLHIDPADLSSGSETKLKEVPDSLLKAALLRRALEDIRRIIQLRGSKAALQSLVQRGSVGDELWQRFLRAEQEMEAEVKDVAQEVRALFHFLAWKTIFGQ
jgi:translocation protein SEC66